MEVTAKDLAVSFGTTENDLPDECQQLIAQTDFRYQVIEGAERDQLLLEILKRIDEDQQIIGAEERTGVWERGWAESLNDFIESGYDLNNIVPKFIRPNQVIRFNQQYIRPSNPNFELDYVKVFRIWLFKKFFEKVDHFYEFGCGTGHNLVAFAGLFPETQLFGLDFVPSSVQLINNIAEKHRFNLIGHQFDMIAPDPDFTLETNSAIFTFGVIEQLASQFEPFLKFLLQNKPCLCVHIEPIMELYDQENLIDYLAIKFHRKRGYTEKFLPRLKEMAAEKRIEILKVKRLYFGSLFMEGYNLIVWKPL